MKEGNDRQLKKFLIVKNILLVINKENAQQTMWRICILMSRFKRPLIIAIAIVIPLQELGFFLKSTFTYIAYTLLEEIFCYFMNSPSFHTPTFVSFFFFFWHGKFRPSTSFKASEIIFVSIDTRLRQNLSFAFDTNPPSYLKSSKLKRKPK